jgi:flotillin
VTLAEAGREARIKVAEAAVCETERRAAADAARIGQVATAEAAANHKRGEAEGAAIRARGLAEAEAIVKRAEALARESEAAAKARGHVEHLTVLNGAEGVAEVMRQPVAQRTTIYKVARELVGDRSRTATPGSHKPKRGQTPPRFRPQSVRPEPKGGQTPFKSCLGWVV